MSLTTYPTCIETCWKADVDKKPLVYDRTLAQWQDQMEHLGQPAYRARQIWSGLYQDLVTDAQQITTLPQALRDRLEQVYSFHTLQVATSLQSKDGKTRKVLLRLHDGKTIEAVLMRYDQRRTTCISTQVGCAMGCVFCATGQMGFDRNLTSGEIIEQVLFFARQLSSQQDRLTNIVFMGMGEPFHNYAATLAAIRRLNDPQGFAFGARRMTLSTVGIVPMIDRFAGENLQVNLAISLHAANDRERDALLPINRRYPLSELLSACHRYVEATHRRVTFEWALIENRNDSPQQAQELAALLKGLLCHVNLIPLNPTAGYQATPSSHERVKAFSQILIDAGIPSTIRARRGIEIQAGCGQLASQQPRL